MPPFSCDPYSKMIYNLSIVNYQKFTWRFFRLSEQWPYTRLTDFYIHPLWMRCTHIPHNYPFRVSELCREHQAEPARLGLTSRKRLFQLQTFKGPGCVLPLLHKTYL